MLRPAAALVLIALCNGCGSDRERHDNPRYEGPNFYESEGAARAGAERAPPQPEAPAGDFFAARLQDGSQSGACASSPRETDDAAARGELGLECPPGASAAISDFAFSLGAGTTGVNFGADAAFPGGTFFYPDASQGLHSDISGGDWHLFGTVTNLSGFGLFLRNCREIDASEYGGIAFRLWGRVDPPGSLVFFVGSAVHQVSSSWLNDHKTSPDDADEPPNLGRCIPIAQRYDNSCREPRIGLPVTEAPTAIQVQWRDLVDGCPAASVDASQITAIAWYFPPANPGYEVDIHLDDLRFTELELR
ncbi:MAG TPA: hypothetical protein VFS67_10845 [Polyangiaceae bacterium]|nr:hypothetical protein [Polyangiaceae bacterium]